MISSNDHYEVLGLEKECTEKDIKKNYRKLVMEYHPDRNFGVNEFSDSAFKKIKRAYDVLSDPELKQKYDDKKKLYTKYNNFINKNKDRKDNRDSEYAFSQLIQGRYPEMQKKRVQKDEEKDSESDCPKEENPKDSKEEIKEPDDTNMDSNGITKGPETADPDIPPKGKVENFRQKVYLDKKWRKVTKSEHIIMNPLGERMKVLTRKVQSPDGNCKIRQKITKL
ncbi:unnamed protein product [Moneuplotes crassus]|uniref:J domain-containing protein n=1 Tax=Euplotes crassus TaxID=5936 RepID=A0AAD1XKQ0_EUPCR|nr:unnamed protein product [Moneuplotes crassus]